MRSFVDSRHTVKPSDQVEISSGASTEKRRDSIEIEPIDHMKERNTIMTTGLYTCIVSPNFK